MNKHLNSLTDYPFQYLSELLQGVESESNDLIGLHIGEPKGNPPEEALDIIKNGAKSYSKYPTSNGEDSLRESYCNWLVKRFSIKDVDPKKNVLPVSGTREGIFSFIQSVIDTSQKNPKVILPNPFYKIYEGAAIMAGAEPYYVNSLEKEGFKPDFDSIPERVWKDCQLLILCSPSNPTGYCLTKEEYELLLNKAEKYDFLLCSDECYIDIYKSSSKAPIGLLECDDITRRDSRSVVFHSLSKRSNLAGLRSGFICASEEIIKKLSLYRTYHGVTLSLPTQMASTWAWNDNKHVEENRIEYDKRYEAAISCLDSSENIIRPEGGFYIWLKLPCDDKDFAVSLYAKQGVLALPGSYLGKEIEKHNPGEGFLRLAVVHDIETVIKAFSAVNKTLLDFK
ncbi:MAG: aminotransferase class I/II-fold pyridoxal phosphate-dependent enzyme [Gammaproteobacteria bacterium]|nr:MAG: aminotransferase class I/II-fold pyridoxal phosphate-dependent enzyme [Gammaproteobacteria bacterium]